MFDVDYEDEGINNKNNGKMYIEQDKQEHMEKKTNRLSTEEENLSTKPYIYKEETP